MNFLAHLHIADYCQSDLSGNLLGDFVKGNPDEKYPKQVVDGIRLHRFVDSYTDTHPTVLQQKHLFGDQLKRFSPIALDMFWDHCLACEWKSFHKLTLTDFVHHCKTTCQLVDYPVPVNYLATMKSMWSGEWLLSYQDINSTLYALERMSQRSPRMGPLADCGSVLLEHYFELRETFLSFYPDVLINAQLLAKKHQQPST